MAYDYTPPPRVRIYEWCENLQVLAPSIPDGYEGAGDTMKNSVSMDSRGREGQDAEGRPSAGTRVIPVSNVQPPHELSLTVRMSRVRVGVYQQYLKGAEGDLPERESLVTLGNVSASEVEAALEMDIADGRVRTPHEPTACFSAPSPRKKPCRETAAFGGAVPLQFRDECSIESQRV